MIRPAVSSRRSGAVLRYSSWDGVLVGLSLAHGAALLMVPSIPLVAMALWWNANTVAHNFIHRPFFCSRPINHLYSLLLSAILGFPQSIWRERHLAHHAGRPVRLQASRAIAAELLLVVAVWATVAALSPPAFFGIYLPGWALGLALCWLQGHYEHARGTTSHYGRVYNALFFNDGCHAEHHLRPGRHWSELGRWRPDGRASRWPPVLRWLDDVSLEGLERILLASPLLQRTVVRMHERAFRKLLPACRDVRSVLIVGGGLFPRTALVLRRLLPEARLIIVDAQADNLDIARRFLDAAVVLRHERFTGVAPPGVDLVVVPLDYVGDRGAIYRHPPARVTLVHDWLWSRRGAGAIVSLLLLKRVNRVVQTPCSGASRAAMMSA
jgi:hypothetical protein